jgi:predicted DNA-binding transcriptional regulator AlpA
MEGAGSLEGTTRCTVLTAYGIRAIMRVTHRGRDSGRYADSIFPGWAAIMLITKGVELLEETPGDGAPVERNGEYVLAIRLTLNNGEVLTARPWEAGMNLGRDDNGFFEHQVWVHREEMIGGLFYAVRTMRIGGYRKVAICPHLAYGEKGIPGQIPPNATLIAEIKVLCKVVRGKCRWQEPEGPEGPEAGMLTQDEVCQRYEITRLTLWRRRKAGQLPGPVLIGASVRWKPSTLEQWEADGQGRVSPCLDEEREQTDRAFARLHELSLDPLENPDDKPVESSESEQREVRELVEEIHRHQEQNLDLELELALLIDEAGQWHGPPLERLLKDGWAAIRESRNLANVLKKALADSTA